MKENIKIWKNTGEIVSDYFHLARTLWLILGIHISLACSNVGNSCKTDNVTYKIGNHTVSNWIPSFYKANICEKLNSTYPFLKKILLIHMIVGILSSFYS